jgi:hypothetical protein
MAKSAGILTWLMESGMQIDADAHQLTEEMM